jgi:uncharacterized protein
MAQGKYGIWTEVNLEADGKQVSRIHVPHATTRSAYGVVDIPIAVIRNGPGPTVLLMGGNHGDEYEGQVVLCDLVRDLEPEDIHGRVIIMPAANLPAALAGTRVSPLDGGNLNASFPGAYGGMATEQIAHFVDNALLPHCDAWLDLHAGGSSLEYLPFACIHRSGKPALDSKALAALRAFGSPLALVWAYQEERAASSAAQRHDVVYLYGEFGGAGTVNPDSVRLVRAGVIRCLAHLGILSNPSIFNIDGPAPKTRFIQVPFPNEDYATNRRYYVFSPAAGLFEPFLRLGDEVAAGQTLGRIHFVDDPGREPAVARFSMEGLLICKRHIGRVERGDCLAHLATDFDPKP